MVDGYRIGHGIDVHKFAENVEKHKPLKLAGITVSDKYSLLAHSDGDVVLHAICDAILGACSKGDIGEHFPDSDSEFNNIDSAQLLERVLSIASKTKLGIINIDVTVIAEVPKLSPLREKMIKSLCDLLSLNSSRCNLKATTTEGLGYLGRKEGIACHCIVLMKKNV